MSHTVTVTRTTTTTSTSAILLNIGYFKTVPGILKVLHVILGVIAVALVGHYISFHKNVYRTYQPEHSLFVPELFFLLIATTCMIASFLLLVSCLISIATATILPKTVFEVVYHLVATVTLLIASIVYIVEVNNSFKAYYKGNNYNLRIAAAEVIFFAPLIFLLLVASANLMGVVVARNKGYHDPEPGYGAKIFSGVLGIVNSVLYGVATFFAYRNWKSG
ncbi:unnamed protein product [Allacma fusca]|uniref:MARVEL domain-containing protein n=1 Tax=Allacma fusca TaxID=39272 RepID=A0A8J2NV93_9HEXA|nr:unnamed protein product [Allacma fusca]